MFPVHTITCMHPLQVVVLLCRSARGWLHWTCCSIWGANWWRPTGIGGPEKGQTETRGRRSNWRTEEAHAAGNGKGFSLCEEALLVFEARTWTQNSTRKVPTTIQKAIPCYGVIYDEKRKELLTRHWHGQRSLTGYSWWGRKDLDMTERLSINKHHWIIFSRS